MKLVAWLSCLVVGLATGTAAPATVASPSPGPAGERAAASHSDAVSIRHSTLLDTDWRSIALDTGAPVPPGVESAGFDDHGWRRVEVPHNWDEYEGFRQLRHGDRHGTAWYRRSFTVDSTERGRRIFLYFEGVGSFATVWVNGTPVGRHAGGLTTFTLDITDAVRFGQSNCLVVRADHPAGIRDLPWVCGGCELAYGFSEGTQPFGIFRPVHLVTTSPVRIEPFGVHVWNDADLDPAAARIHVTTEVKNYGPTATTVAVVTRVIDSPPGPARQAGAVVSESSSVVTLAAGATTIVAQEPPPIAHAQLWSPDSPHLYALESEILDAGPLAGRPPSSALPARHGVVDTLTTPFGIRTVRWPAAGSQDGRLLINGRPFFLNGICDYEHNLGASGAFTSEEIRARVHEIEAAGFNAFRDAHTPHNLRFQKYWDRDGLLWWPQFGAHIWFDHPEFRANFKARLRDWVKERRNSPSLVLWGLQNESVLPTKFAEECSAIIRELDPTASSQRKITTCNGGTGTDWNVPQNWSGTYGGNPLAYADELRRDHLFGEYGAWRSLGLHTEGGFQPNGPLSEDRMCALLETKVRLAESVRDKVAGHFLWLFATHSNPGRNVGEHGEQQDDGIRPLDHIGPANNKGLFTIWGEPTDAYQMYRSDYASAATAPMVYIVSHTWPDRWTTPGAKSGIVVYSNCDQVELFNDLRSHSLGVRSRPSAAGPGRTIAHFEWDNVPVTTNILYAEGLVNGTVVARDIIELHHLEPAPAFRNWQDTQRDPVAPRPGRTYLYRVNCGGPDYVDRDGNRWAADHDYSPGDSWGSISWAAAFPNLPPRFGSQRKTYDPIAGTRDPALFRTYRYGRDQLRYVFSVPNGEYEVELYFVEPWYGDWTADHLPGPTVPVPSAHAAGLDCTGWRLFDVAVNGSTVLQHLDLWREAGRDTALKKIVPAKVTDGRLEISFPRVESGQAVISAIAICVASNRAAAAWHPAPNSALVTGLTSDALPGGFGVVHALDTGDQTYRDVADGFTALPPELLEADWIRAPDRARTAVADRVLQFSVTRDATVYVAHAATGGALPRWLSGWERTKLILATNAAPGVSFALFRQDVRAGSSLSLGRNTTTGDPSTPMYTVFVVPRRPAPPAQMVRDLTAATAAPASAAQAEPRPDRHGVRATGDLQVGREIYPDSDTRVASLPATLTDCDLVSPSSEGKRGISFSVSAEVEVYVALDSRIEQRPAWLADWIVTRDTIMTTGTFSGRFVLVHHRFTPGQRVELGANGTLPSGAPAAMYFVIVRAVRPALHLDAEDASLRGAFVLNRAGNTGHGAVSLPAGAGHVITWTVPVGVGDRYGLDFRFTASTPCGPTPARLTIVDAEGHVLRTDKLTFPAVPDSARWTHLRTRTGSSINAGTYEFRLTLTGPSPLIIDSLEVE